MTQKKKESAMGRFLFAFREKPWIPADSLCGMEKALAGHLPRLFL